MLRFRVPSRVLHLKSCRTHRGLDSARSLLFLRTYSAYPPEGVFQRNETNNGSDDFDKRDESSRTRSWGYKVIGASLCAGAGFLTTAIDDEYPYRDAETDNNSDNVESFMATSLDRFKAFHDLRDSPTPYREFTAYSGLKRSREQRLTTGPLAGPEGVACQRIFINEEDNHLRALIRFGRDTSGWPNIVHGGAIATIFDEMLGRVAIRSTEKKTGVTAKLNIDYAKPVIPGRWYEVGAHMMDNNENSENKKWVEAYLVPADHLLDQVEVCAKAEALFVVPKTAKTATIEENF